MTLLLWIVVYIAEILFWLWIVIWGGAEFLDGTWLLNLIFRWGASDWDPETTKLVGWFFIISTTFWFVLGLIDPRMRFYSAQMVNQQLNGM